MARISYYTAVLILSWMSLIILTILVLENDRLPKKDKGILVQIYVVVGLAALAEWLGIYFSGNPDISPWVIRGVKCADYILTPIAGGMMVLRIDRRDMGHLLVGVIMATNTVFQLASLYTGWMLKLDSENNYYHGSLYLVYMWMYFALMVLIVIEYIIYGQRFRRQNRASLYGVMIMVVTGVLMQELGGRGIRTAYLALTLGLALLFIHSQEFVQLSKDDSLNEQRFQILMSQIRPHFLYNTLGGIQELCESNPKEAAQATATFAHYLRGNMDSLGKTEPIPFAKELEHTKLYLELEKMRFESALQIFYEIECTDFEIPALTLQPIAENAVRHGVRGKKGGIGAVGINTCHTDRGYEIKVIDNGTGFDTGDKPQSSDGRSHIGIENVRERLQRMCGGRLEINSVPGKGTVALIIIPDKAKSGAQPAGRG